MFTGDVFLIDATEVMKETFWIIDEAMAFNLGRKVSNILVQIFK